MINVGSRFVAIGIMIKFIDLFKTLLVTGIWFVIIGFIIVVIAFVAEKYRKKLINKISENHALEK